MKFPSKTQSCPVCGSLMVYETRDEIVEYNGHGRIIETLGYWCTNCGEGILTGKPLVASENAYMAFKEEMDALERLAERSQE